MKYIASAKKLYLEGIKKPQKSPKKIRGDIWQEWPKKLG